MGVRGLLRRILSEPVTASATLITVALALVSLAAGPIYADAVSVGALRHGVANAPADDKTIEIALRTAPETYAALDSLVQTSLERALGVIENETSRALESSAPFQLGQAAIGEQQDVAKFVSLASIEKHASLTVGGWPSDSSPELEVAVDERLVSAFGLELGKQVLLVSTTRGDSDVLATVGGHYVIDDRSESYWSGRDSIADSVRESRSFRSIVLIADEAQMLSGAFGRVEASWLAIPRFDQLQLDDVASVRAGVASLEATLNRNLESQNFETGSTSEIEVNTSVPALLAQSDRSLTVARSAVFAVLAQLGLLSIYALVLVARLGVDVRAGEASTLRARGAGSKQVLGLAVIEGLGFVLPVVLVAPWVGSWLLRAFDEFGPLASIGLEISPKPVAVAFVVIAGAAMGTIGLLAWPAYKSAQVADSERGRNRRQRLSSASQRAGLDIALVLVTVLAYWQLRTLGAERSATVRGRFGVDPLVIAAPILGLAAGAFLALRIIPLLARFAERTVSRSKSIVVALFLWQLARRPRRYASTALLLIMAVAIGTFALTYETTWQRSQVAQADFQTGGDLRVAPNRRTNDSVSDLHLISAHESLDGVANSLPVMSSDLRLSGDTSEATLLAVDAVRGSAISRVASWSNDIESALSLLAGRRSELPGIELPGNPVALKLGSAIANDPEESSLDESQDGPQGEPFRGEVSIVLQDGHGYLHRLAVGAISEDDGGLFASLATTDSSGVVLTPSYPLSLIGLEVRSTTPQTRSRKIVLEIGPLVVVNRDNSAEAVVLAGRDLTLETEVLGFAAQSPSVNFNATQPANGIGLVLETGSGQATPVLFNVSLRSEPVPSAVPAVVTNSWLEATGTAVGDEVSVSSVRSRTERIEIIAAIDAVPTIDPTAGEGILLDLPTLQMMTFTPGQPIVAVTEHWLELEAGAADFSSNLTAKPIEAVSIVSRNRTQAALLADPASLSAIGGLTIGYIAAALFAAVGFLATSVVSARERSSEFALVNALGLTRAQLRRWMLLEQAALISISLAFGLAVGLGLSALALPQVSLTPDGSPVFPNVVVTYPWVRIAWLQSLLVLALIGSLAAVTRVAQRLSIGKALRGGGEA